MNASENGRTLPENPAKGNESLLFGVTGAVRELLGGRDLKSGIAHALRTIGEASDVDRVYIFEKHELPDRRSPAASQRYEWVHSGISPQAANPLLQNLEYLGIFADWHETLSAGKIISGLTRTFPEPQRKFLEAQEIVSILIVPICVEKSLWGFIGFDDCRRERLWSGTEISYLSAIAANIGYMLLHEATDQNLKLFKAAIESTPDAIGMADMECRHFYNNKAFTDLLEYTTEDLEKGGGPIAAVKDKETGRKIFDSIFKGGQWEGELDMISRSGKTMPLLLRASAIKDEKGRTISALGVFTDIRKQKEALLRFQAALDSTGDAVGMADMQGRHFYQNEAFTRLFGYTVEEIDKAGGPSILFGSQFDHQKVFQTILAGGSWHGELNMRTRDGRLLPILLRADAVRGKDGKVSAVFGIHTDISKQKETERILQESETRYRRLVEATTGYIYTVRVENGNAAGTVHGPNCIAITGYSSEEYQADPDLWFKMVHPQDREAVLKQAQKVLKNETSQPIEHRIFHKNGSLRWVRNTPVPHFDTNGRLISYDGLVSDVTERRMAEEKLKDHAYKLGILNRIITAVNRVDNLAMLLNESLKSSMEMISFVGGGIYLVNAENTMAHLVCRQGMPDETTALPASLKSTSADNRMLFIEARPMFIDDSRIGEPERAEQHRIKSIAKVPLLSGNKLIGALVLINAHKHVFEEKEKELLLAIGRQIGTAISKMRSEIALRESEGKYRTITEQSLIGIQIIKDGILIFVNDGWSKITGYAPSDVATWKVEEYIKIVHPEDCDFFLEQARKKQLGLSEGILPIYDCRFLSKSGEVKWVSIFSKTVAFADGRAAVGVVIDVTDRKMALAALENANRQLSAINKDLLKANREKEILLKEIHHRVKNNLQIIHSLINLQIRKIADRQAVNLLKECQSRIRTIAIVHEKMYQLGDLTRVDIGSYLADLMRHIAQMYLTDSSAINIIVNVKDVFLSIDQAIPCALLINELVSNSLKYAFPKRKDGEINIDMSAGDSGKYVLCVRDNGIGLPAKTNVDGASSLGMQLVTTFVNQLRGRIELENKGGACFKITFARSEKEA